MKLKNPFRRICGGVALLSFVFMFPHHAMAQQHGPSWLDPQRPLEAAQAYQDHLQTNHGTTVSGLINAQSQMFMKSPEHEGKGRSSTYYWLQINQCLWTGACVSAEVEGGWGSGLDRLMETYSILNGNAGEPSPLYIPKVYLTQSLLNERLVLYAGKLDLSSWFDLNDVANSSDIQFLSSALVYNLAIPFPENGLGMMAEFNLSEQLYVQAGMSDAGAVSTHTGFDTAFEGDAKAFSLAELGWCPAIRDQPGHYRFILWHDQRELPRFDDDGDEAGHAGFALSFDQGLNDVLTLFCRYGYEDPDVYTIEHFWSCGAQLAKILSARPNDMAGLAMAQSILSPDYRGSSEPRPEPSETLYEAYYSIAINDYVTLTPVVQCIHHPLGEADADEVVTGGARLVLAF